MTKAYVVFIIAPTFPCNVFLGEETRAISLSMPMILKELGVTAWLFRRQLRPHHPAADRPEPA